MPAKGTRSITTEMARKILGESASKLSDQEIQRALDMMYSVAIYAYEEVVEEDLGSVKSED